MVPTGSTAPSVKAKTERGCDRSVLQVITDTDRRGAQVFAADLEAGLGEQGYSVTTVALAPGQSPAGLPYEALGEKRLSVQTLHALRRRMTSAGAVIAHGSTTLPACAAAGAGLPVPTIYRQISEQLFWANTAAKRARVKVALRGIDSAVALWAGAEQDLVEHFGMRPSQVSIIPNGVPARRVQPVTTRSKADARCRLDLDAERKVVLSLGALVPEKGVDLLVRAVAQMPDTELLVVGAGPELESLKRLARELGAATRFLPPVADVTEVMAAADVLALASRGGDSMPAVLIEAGLAELPCVATPVEGIVDVIQHERTGMLTTAEDIDALVTAVRVACARGEELGRAARRHCLEHFEIGVVSQAWATVIDAAHAAAALESVR
jgi:glycosyltransferase involved in cell wall biosynthesis